jgi:polysaccharide export outer membrane protein
MIKHVLPILAIALPILLCSCSTRELARDAASQTGPPQLPLMVAQPDTHFVMIGDSVVFSVWGYPEFTTRTVVGRSGTITVPLVGQITAAGRTRDDFRQYIRQRLAEFIQGEIRITIEITSPIPQIMVFGNVPKQGNFPASSDLSLLEVLTSAGGWTDQSDLRHILISFQRTPGKEGGTVEVNLESYLESGNLRSVPLVHPGDLVYVPRKANAIRDLADYLRDVFLIFGFFRLLY